MSAPQWATPKRQSQLVKFAMKYKGVCLEGHYLCGVVEINEQGELIPAHYVASTTKTVPDWKRVTKVRHLARQSRDRSVVETEELCDLYEQQADLAIDAWKVEDRDERKYAVRAASQNAPTGEVGTFGRFKRPGRYMTADPVEVDEFTTNRPNYYDLGFEIDQQYRKIAKIRVAGTQVILRVDVSNSFQEVPSRDRRKKLRKRGIEFSDANVLIRQAVDSFWGR